jgi:hypothetical protein
MTSPTGNREISPTSMVVATKDQVSADIGGETILLSMNSAMYYGMESVASLIWSLLREPIRVSDICDAIVGEYDVEKNRCEADLLAFLRALAEKDLIEVTHD